MATAALWTWALVLLFTWASPVEPMKAHPRKHINSICSVWGKDHFKTFDGDIYQFPGMCEYNLVSDCHEAYLDFSVHMKRAEVNGHPTVSRIVVTIKDRIIVLTRNLVTMNGEKITTPYYGAGVLLDTNTIYTKLYSKLGLSVMWNGEDAVTLELDSKYQNRTCGLCGDFNGIPLNFEFLEEGREISPIEFGNRQKVHLPTELCEDPPEEDEFEDSGLDKCSKFRDGCTKLLQSEDWKSCARALSPGPYIQACVQDMCSCGDVPDDFCICSTLAEYSRQCSHAGGTPPNWRTQDFCVKQCPLNMVYAESGSACMNTCTNRDTSQLCEEHHVDGCVCPEGTVFDDISERGCIRQEQCQCVHDKAYNSGEVLLQDCEECVCNQGRWSCKSLPCPGQCAIEGGSHVTTYDGKAYTFHGDCYYILTKDNVGSKFTVLGQLVPCGSQDLDTCLKSVVLLLNNDKNNALVIKADGKVSHNAEISLPYSTANVHVFRPSSFHIILQTDFGLQLHIQLIPIMQLYITLDQTYLTKTCGLCGNFNMVLHDDLKTPQGLVEGTAASFANSWKAQASCPNRMERLDDPCSLSIENENYAEYWCSMLQSQKSEFSKCHTMVDPEAYYRRCKYSSCNCEKSEDCLCAVFSSYVRACQAKGVELQGWRTNICGKYTETCPASQTFSYQLQQCQRTCRSLGSERPSCSTDFLPVDGCSCPEGLYQDDRGVCVPVAKCPCYHNGDHIKPGKSITIKEEHCVCSNGRLHCRSWKARSERCPSPKVFFSCSSADANAQGIECARTCSNLGGDCFSSECESGCQCPSGLLDDGRGNCVKEHECPCLHDGHFYAPGRQIPDRCNTCTCTRGMWNCTDHICPGSCTIYGSGHHLTFDERRFGFRGQCGYVAVQDKCGNKTGMANFRVITENIPCGSTGTTCSKSVRIFLGSTELKLSEGKVEQVSSNGLMFIEYKVRTVGLYIVVESKIGFSVVWDRKTTVRIILEPDHMGKVCGLCGDFDGDAKDDFTTQGQLVVSSPLEFANSWKVSSSCPDAAEDTDPCSLNPHRHGWAMLQCSIIKGNTFKNCHDKVDPIPYYENCVSDSCACDSGGDCECFCTAVAAYAQACNEAGVCVAWRTPDLCPVYCDYFNAPHECQWHYSPCHPACYKTCFNPDAICSDLLPNMEGCYPSCPPDKPIFDEAKQICVEKCDGCYINDTEYRPGEEVPTEKPCTSCICVGNETVTCEHKRGCCVYNGTEYDDGDIIYDVTDNMGMCYYAICKNETVIHGNETCTTTPRPTTTPVTTTTVPPTPTTTPVTTTTTETPTPTTTPVTTTTTEPPTTTPVTTTTKPPTPTTTPVTTTTTKPPTTTPCIECDWSDWFDVDKPSFNKGDWETYKNITASGKEVCQDPQDIDCRAASAPDMSLDEFVGQTNQVVHCNISFGLICKNEEQVARPYKCVNYKIKLYCCIPCAGAHGSTTPVTTTTTEPPTTTPVTTTTTEPPTPTTTPVTTTTTETPTPTTTPVTTTTTETPTPTPTTTPVTTTTTETPTPTPTTTPVTTTTTETPTPTPTTPVTTTTTETQHNTNTTPVTTTTTETPTPTPTTTPVTTTTTETPTPTPTTTPVTTTTTETPTPTTTPVTTTTTETPTPTPTTTPVTTTTTETPTPTPTTTPVTTTTTETPTTTPVTTTTTETPTPTTTPVTTTTTETPTTTPVTTTTTETPTPTPTTTPVTTTTTETPTPTPTTTPVTTTTTETPTPTPTTTPVTTTTTETPTTTPVTTTTTETPTPTTTPVTTTTTETPTTTPVTTTTTETPTPTTTPVTTTTTETPTTTPVTTTTETPTPTTTPVTTTTTKPPTTTPCICIVNGTYYHPGATIVNMTHIGSGICLTMICSDICKIENSTDICPVTPTPPKPPAPTTTPVTTTTEPPTPTTTPQSTKHPGCPEWGVLKNETFLLCNCTMAVCIEDNIIAIVPYECPPLKEITCTNGKKPVLQMDKYQCCEEYVCDCDCEGWGDPHYITFDGEFYSFQGNCTYVLMEEIMVWYKLKIYIDNVHCDPAEVVSCPRSLIVVYEAHTFVLKNHNLLGAADLEAIINGAPGQKLPYLRNNIKIINTGIDLVLEIPGLGVVITFGVTGFSIHLPFKFFGNNTQGQCGTCNNNKADDCMLPGGQLVDCAVMGDYWLVEDLYRPDCSVPPSLPTSAPGPSPTDKPCGPNPICDLLKSSLFAECHAVVSPEPFFRGCVFDSCHMVNPTVECTSLHTYAATCMGSGICVDWRNQTEKCPSNCPPDKVYKPCGPAEQPTCEDTDEDPSMRFMTEGCFCPDGMKLFNKESGVCVAKCGCLDPNGEPREFNEVFQYKCQDCICDEPTKTVICKPMSCPGPGAISCTKPGFVIINETNPENPCCSQLVCRCDSRTCPALNPKCKEGYIPVISVPEGECCPTYECEPKKVCVHNNMEYLPGASIPVEECQDCTCTTEVDPHSGLYKMSCSLVPCNQDCEPGFRYIETPQDKCCGKCVQTHCVVEIDGKIQLLEHGHTWSPPGNKCVVHSCIRINGTFVSTLSNIKCPPFHPSNCQPGTIQVSADGCCNVCVEKERACKVETTRTHIFHANCQSVDEIDMTYCEGACNTFSKYNAASVFMQHSCTCCQESRTSNRTANLLCLNGELLPYSYVHVEECRCKVTDCYALNEAARPVRPKRAGRSLP
ncbi:mucin-2-like [Anguilla rostrata]|uniref:mucin-2-like n=1 Tax=Anguilla rostrata TaxID=7938 RepID=UPI0030CCA30F